MGRRGGLGIVISGIDSDGQIEQDKNTLLTTRGGRARGYGWMEIADWVCK